MIEVSPSDLDFILEQIEDIKDEEITEGDKEEIRNRILDENRSNQDNIDSDILVYSKLCKIRAYLMFFGGDRSDIEELIQKYEKRIDNEE